MPRCSVQRANGGGMCFVAIDKPVTAIESPKSHTMKKVNVLFAGLLSLGILQACNDASNNDSIEKANEANEEKMDSADDNANSTTANNASQPAQMDADFAVSAASGGLLEVELGQMAQMKAQHPRVKNFASMMVRDHSKANEELKTLASTKNITLPTVMGDEHKNHLKDVSDKSAKDFDRAYMDMMVEDHEEDVKKFEKAANDAQDADLKAWAAKTLPVLRGHLDSARAIHNAMKNK